MRSSKVRIIERLNPAVMTVTEWPHLWAVVVPEEARLGLIVHLAVSGKDGFARTS
jgi:hypothetical protein